MTGQIYHLFPISSSLFPATSPETETVDYLQGAFGSGPSPQLNFRRLSPCGSDRLDSASGRGENSQPRNSISLPMPIAQNGCKDKRTHETRTREGFSSPEGSSPRNVRVDSPVTSDPAFADLIELPLRDEALGDRVSGPDEHVLFSNGDVLFDDEQSSFLFGGDRDFDDGEEELLSEEESPKGVEEKRSKEREKEEDQYLDAEQEQKKMKLRRKEKEGESKERIEQKVMFLEPKASRSLFRSKKHEEKPEGNLKQTRQDNEKLKLFQSDGSLALMNKDLEKDIQEKRHTFSLSENLAMRKIDETEEKREEKEEKGHPKRFRKLPNRGNPNEDELLADGDLLSGKWFCRFRASLPLALRNKDSSSDLYDSKHKIGSGLNFLIFYFFFLLSLFSFLILFFGLKGGLQQFMWQDENVVVLQLKFFPIKLGAKSARFLFRLQTTVINIGRVEWDLFVNVGETVYISLCFFINFLFVCCRTILKLCCYLTFLNRTLSIFIQLILLLGFFSFIFFTSSQRNSTKLKQRDVDDHGILEGRLHFFFNIVFIS